jgi:ferredoxin
MIETTLSRNPARDLGTPPPLNPNMEFVTLTIDGERVTVAAGTSVMRAAAESGTNIPKLCATDSLEPFGSCRLCLVEIEGRRGYPASCTTPVEEGMVVRTQTSKLQELRKGVMELYISDHPLDCLTCPANGNCELQDMAGVTGLREVRYGYEGANHLKLKKDESNPYFTFDSSKCIVCNRCVRACEETQGTFALTISGRGFESRVSAGQSESFMESECVSCGACVEACPTATLQEKSVIWLGQAEHKVTTTCAYCGVGCSLDAEMKGSEVVRMVPAKDGKANEGHACVKGRFAWGYATHKDRILKPMIRSKITDPWKEVSWDEALDYAASEFKRIQAKYGQDSIGGIVSSRCTNEEGYLVQKLVRAAFGNNNVDTCARVCHSPTGYGLKQTLGESAGTQTFKSVEVRRHHGDRRQSDRRPPGVRLAHEAPHAPGREADRHRSAPHRPGQVAARAFASTTCSCVPAPTSPCCQLAGPRDRHRRPAGRAVHRRTLRGPRVQPVARLRGAGIELAGSDGIGDRRAGRAGARRRAPVCHRRQRRHLLRPGRDRACARFDHRDGHRQPGDGHRERRPRRRRRQSAARPEQRAGFVRHRLLPARTAGLPPRLRQHRAHAVRGRMGRELQAEPGLRIPNMFEAALDGSFSACTARARTSCSPIRTRST